MNLLHGMPIADHVENSDPSSFVFIVFRKRNHLGRSALRDFIDFDYFWLADLCKSTYDEIQASYTVCWVLSLGSIIRYASLYISYHSFQILYVAHGGRHLGNFFRGSGASSYRKAAPTFRCEKALQQSPVNHGDSYGSRGFQADIFFSISYDYKHYICWCSQIRPITYWGLYDFRI